MRAASASNPLPWAPLLPDPPYLRDDTEDLGNRNVPWRSWAGTSRSEAWIPSCNICSSKAAHTEGSGEKPSLAHSMLSQGSC